MSTVIIIDGKNYCYRSAWTRQALHSNSRPTGMIYGSIASLLRLNRIHPGAAFVFCWDGENAKKSWRHEICKEYKANRSSGKGEAPDFVKQIMCQIPVLMSFLETMGFQQLKVESLEADDLIGILSQHVKGFVDKVIIYSTDRDFYQLIDKNVQVVRDTEKKLKCRPISVKEIKEEYGVVPKDWLKYRALVGDKGDNIKKNFGTKRVGTKTAIKLLAQGLDASKQTCQLEDFKPYWKTIRLNYKLSKILRSFEATELNHNTRAAIEKLVRRYKCFEDLGRTVEGKLPIKYQYLLIFLAKLEMEELIGRRSEIWSIK